MKGLARQTSRDNGCACEFVFILLDIVHAEAGINAAVGVVWLTRLEDDRI